MYHIITCQIGEYKSEDAFNRRITELVQFGALLGLKIRQVEERHYNDTFRARLDGKNHYKAYTILNSLTAYCALKHIACRVDFVE